MTDSELMRLSEQVGLALKRARATVTTAAVPVARLAGESHYRHRRKPARLGTAVTIVMMPKRR